MAELSPAEKDEISHRGQGRPGASRAAVGCACSRSPCRPPTRPASRAPLIAPAAVEGTTKFGAARLSVVSNSLLIVLKIAAGAITGSVAIVTEAVHSSIDLLASVVAYLSLRKADEPADESHMYGHAKIENVAAAIEGMLILVGAGVIVFEAVRRLATSAHVDNLGVGIAVIGFSAAVNFGVSEWLYRQARAHDSPALEGDAAHLRADAWTSLGGARRAWS